MAPSRRDALTGARLALGPLLCVAGVLAVLFLGAASGARSPAAPSHDAALSLVERHLATVATRRPAIAPARGTALTRAPAAGDERASRRACASPSRAAGQHGRPFDAVRTAEIDLARWAPRGARSRLCTAGLQSRSSARRSDERPSSIERDVHAPRAPPSSPSA